MNNIFKLGFVKRATEYGLSSNEAILLAKKAGLGLDDIMNAVKSYGGSGLEALGKGWNNLDSTAKGALIGGGVGLAGGALNSGEDEEGETHRFRNALLGGAGGALAGGALGKLHGNGTFNDIQAKAKNYFAKLTGKNKLTSEEAADTSERIPAETQALRERMTNDPGGQPAEALGPNLTPEQRDVLNTSNDYEDLLKAPANEDNPYSERYTPEDTEEQARLNELYNPTDIDINQGAPYQMTSNMQPEEGASNDSSDEVLQSQESGREQDAYAREENMRAQYPFLFQNVPDDKKVGGSAIQSLQNRFNLNNITNPSNMPNDPNETPAQTLQRASVQRGLPATYTPKQQHLQEMLRLQTAPSTPEWLRQVLRNK
jgi:hypothetical protein